MLWTDTQQNMKISHIGRTLVDVKIIDWKIIIWKRKGNTSQQKLLFTEIFGIWFVLGGLRSRRRRRGCGELNARRRVCDQHPSQVSWVPCGECARCTLYECRMHDRTLLGPPKVLAPRLLKPFWFLLIARYRSRAYTYRKKNRSG